MKIISEAPDYKPFEDFCNECNAELQIEKDDIQYYYSDSQREGTFEYFYYKCVVCGEQNEVNDSHVPTLMAKQLQKRGRGR